MINLSYLLPDLTNGLAKQTRFLELANPLQDDTLEEIAKMTSRSWPRELAEKLKRAARNTYQKRLCQIDAANAALELKRATCEQAILQFKLKNLDVPALLGRIKVDAIVSQELCEVVLIQKRHRSAFAIVLQTTYDRCCRAVAQVGFDWETAQDIVQEFFQHRFIIWIPKVAPEPFNDECIVGRCVFYAREKLNNDRYFVLCDVLNIEPFGKGAKLTIPQHGIGSEPIMISDSAPNVDGEYLGQPPNKKRTAEDQAKKSLYKVVDSHSIWVPVPIQEDGGRGVIRYRARRLIHPLGDIDPADGPKPDWWKTIEPPLGGLNDRERQVLELYYREGLSDKEIEERLPITSQRVGQIRREALEKLRRLLDDDNQ